jgi:hypothetical protein
MSLSEILVRLLHCAQWIAIDESLNFGPELPRVIGATSFNFCSSAVKAACCGKTVPPLVGVEVAIALTMCLAVVFRPSGEIR